MSLLPAHEQCTRGCMPAAQTIIMASYHLLIMPGLLKRTPIVPASVTPGACSRMPVCVPEAGQRVPPVGNADPLGLQGAAPDAESAAGARVLLR
jgi:hypothetical protein